VRRGGRWLEKGGKVRLGNILGKKLLGFDKRERTLPGIPGVPKTGSKE
jgi:hypothetical protein